MKRRYRTYYFPNLSRHMTPRDSKNRLPVTCECCQASRLMNEPSTCWVLHLCLMHKLETVGLHGVADFSPPQLECHEVLQGELLVFFISIASSLPHDMKTPSCITIYIKSAINYSISHSISQKVVYNGKVCLCRHN